MFIVCHTASERTDFNLCELIIYMIKSGKRPGFPTLVLDCSSENFVATVRINQSGPGWCPMHAHWTKILVPCGLCATVCFYCPLQSKLRGLLFIMRNHLGHFSHCCDFVNDASCTVIQSAAVFTVCLKNDLQLVVRFSLAVYYTAVWNHADDRSYLPLYCISTYLCSCRFLLCAFFSMNYI